MTTHLREAIALAIFRAEEENPTVEFDTDEQWEKRISIFDSQPNPREDYLRYADAVLEVIEAEKAEAAAPLKVFVRDLATHGIRFDLNPTIDSRNPSATDNYVGRIDADIRARAAGALRLAAEAGITVDMTAEEKS